MKRKREEKAADESSEPPDKRKVQEQMTTVKCGLRSLLRDNTVGAVFQDAVVCMTQMSYEAAKLLNLHALRLCEEKQSDFSCFKAQTVVEYAFRLVSKVDKPPKDGREVKERGQPKVLEQKRLLRETYQNLYLPTRPDKLPIPSRSRLGSVLHSARRTYLTVSMNHVITNFYRRHRQFIRSCVEELIPSIQGAKLIGAVVYRISEETTCLPKATRGKALAEHLRGNVQALQDCEILVTGIRQRLQKLNLFPVTTHKLERDWSDFLPYLHDILQRAEHCSRDAATESKSEHKIDSGDAKREHEETKSKGEAGRPSKRTRKGPKQPHNYKVPFVLRSRFDPPIPTEQGPKTFTLLPEFSMQLKNIIVDTTALHEICQGIQADSKRRGEERKAYPETDAELWARVLHVDRIPRHGGNAGYRFGHYISTDGVCVNLNLRRTVAHPKPKKEEKSAGQQQSSKFEPIDLAGRRVVGLDPGRGDLFVSMDEKDEKVKCGTKEYYSKAGFTRRQWETRRWMKRNPEIDQALKTAPSSRVSSTRAYLVHLRHVLSAYAICETFYKQPRHRRWKQRVYIGKQKTLNRLCQDITRRDPETVVAFGAASFSSSSKGHAAGPVQALKTCLRRHCTVVEVDEFRTSQLCSKCQCRDPMQGHEKSMNPYKVRVCPNQECRTVWNRDVNAARNMRAIFLYLNDHEGQERPLRFRR